VKDLDNIEELFRENLSGFESDPGVGVWENIAQNLPAQNVAASSTAAAAGKTGLLKLVAGGLIAVTGITLSVVYFTSDSEEKKADQKETVKSDNSQVENKEITANNSLEENNISENTEVVSEETDLQQKDIIVKDEKKNKTMIVTVKEKNVLL
jgi:hypothetical protein